MKTITIVGCGALGSHVAQLLRNEGLLRLIDFDRIEQKNVLAQFHGKTNVGQLKASALSHMLQFLWGVRATALTAKLTAQNAKALLPGLAKDALIIDCLDNGEARRVVQKHARETGVPCLHGALAADGAFGRSIWDEHFTIDDESGVGAPTCDGGDHLPFIARVSTHIAASAQMFLHKGTKVGFSISPHGTIAV